MSKQTIIMCLVCSILTGVVAGNIIKKDIPKDIPLNWKAGVFQIMIARKCPTNKFDVFLSATQSKDMIINCLDENLQPIEFKI